MKIDFSQHYEKLKIFLQNISGKTLLICHYDADGLISALIFSRILEKYNLKYNQDFFLNIARDSYRSEFLNKPEILDNLEEYDNIILLDYCFDSYSKIEHKNLFVFDHHLSGEQNKDYILNPAWQVKATDLPAASAIVYELYIYLFGENKLLKQISFIGVASDFMVFASLPYMHTNEHDSDLFLSNSILIKPIIFDIFKNLQYIYENNGEEIKLFEHLLNHTKNNLIGFFFFQKEHQNIILTTEKAELEHSQEILENIEVDNELKLALLNLDSGKKQLKKYILNILEYMFPDYTKLICISRKKLFSCSLRSSQINLLDLITNLKTKIPNFNGGGHSFAAGCAGPLENKEQLLSELKNRLRNNS